MLHSFYPCINMFLIQVRQVRFSKGPDLLSLIRQSGGYGRLCRDPGEVVAFFTVLGEGV